VPPTPGSDAGPDVTPGNGCLADLFVQPDPHALNGAYPDPMLEARCEDGNLIVESNAIPGFEFVALTPNALRAQDFLWTVPLEPTLADAPTDIPLLGTAAFTVRGLPIYGPNEAAFPDPYGDPVYNDIVDTCFGHTGGNGDYHHHALAVACITAATPADEPSPIIAFALDGFPIYGPRGCADEGCAEIVEYGSGWVQTGDPTTYAWDNHQFVADDDPLTLDQCNGHVGPDGDYHYHATATFPRRWRRWTDHLLVGQRLRRRVPGGSDELHLRGHAHGFGLHSRLRHGGGLPGAARWRARRLHRGLLPAGGWLRRLRSGAAEGGRPCTTHGAHRSAVADHE
jgi:hypothetical protein